MHEDPFREELCLKMTKVQLLDVTVAQRGELTTLSERSGRRQRVLAEINSIVYGLKSSANLVPELRKIIYDRLVKLCTDGLNRTP